MKLQFKGLISADHKRRFFQLGNIEDYPLPNLVHQHGQERIHGNHAGGLEILFRVGSSCSSCRASLASVTSFASASRLAAAVTYVYYCSGGV